MRTHVGSLRQLDDHAVLAGVIEAYRSNREQTAEFLRFLAEFDRRKLFRAAGYPSAHQFCVRHMRMSEDQSYKHLRAARAGRRFPVVFEMIADGRSNVSAIKLLSKHLTASNGEALLRDATGRTNKQVLELLAERFPQADVPTVMFALATPVKAQGAPASEVSEMTCELAVRPVEANNPLRDIKRIAELPTSAIEIASTSPVPALPYTRVAPLSPASYALQCTLSAAVHAKLREVQDLLGPRISPSDISQVLDLALDALIERLERTRKAALRRQEAAGTGSDTTASPVAETTREAVPPAGRYIPRAVRRAVWARDEGRCRFVSATGRRCEARCGLEIDHVRPVSLGGTNESGNLRLLCRAHNQLEAERRLGAAFMGAKRAAAAP